MATAEQVATLREMVGEPDDTNGWTDEKLGNLIDELVTLDAAASQIWFRKASGYAALVDVSESGSSRKLSDLHKNALAMGAFYKGNTVPTPAPDVPVINRIRRGF